MEKLFHNINISHIASAIPFNTLNLLEFSKVYGDSEVRKIINSTGISKVRIAPNGMTTSDLCSAAFSNIIENSDLDKEEIDAIIFVSQTPDYRLPQTSNIIQDKFKLHKRTVCFDLPMGCSGYINGLLQASMLIAAGCRKVLLMAGDTSTHLINKNDRTVTMVFGDGGSATIIEPGCNDLYINICSDGSGADKLVVEAGGFRLPSNLETGIALEVEPGIFRSKNDLYMDGMAIMNFAISEVPDIINDSLNYLNWNSDDVGCYAFHQANAFMLNYLRKKIKIPAEKVPISIDGFGNTGPASIPLMLSSLYPKLSENNQLEKVVMCGFGVGLSWGTACSNLSKTKFYKPIEI
jgi:3-oxoacyl-[acyl-carrier-protein] synthase-3